MSARALLVGNDPAEAAAGLVRLSRGPELWQRCSVQSRALVEAGYGADQCFERWLGVIEQQRRLARPRFPIRSTDLRRLLPLADPRFQSHYPPPPPVWSRLHPRRVLGRLRRGIARITITELAGPLGSNR
jgi:hypothetical protein